MYAIYGNIYHQYTPNVSIYIYTIHGSYGVVIQRYPKSGRRLPEDTGSPQEEEAATEVGEVEAPDRLGSHV